MVVKKRIFGFSAHKNVIGFGRNDGLGQWIRKQLRVPELPLHFGPGTSVTSPLRGGFELELGLSVLRTYMKPLLYALQ